MVVGRGASELERNSWLQVVAERYFQKIAPGKAEQIVRQVAEALINRTDLDLMAEDVSQVSPGGLKLVLAQTSAK